MVFSFKRVEKLVNDLTLIDYYLRLVTVTGLAGAYIKKSVQSDDVIWCFWCWFISSVICDMADLMNHRRVCVKE